MQQTKEQLILDRYEIETEHGSGGFSTVYKAFDTKMERFGAIKVIPASSKENTWAKREAQTSARLNHLGVATIYEYEEVDDRHYLIMEFLEGITLRDVLNRFKVLKPHQAAAILSEIAIALEYAHINYVVHRDIKPENIMILKDGRVKITDFGTARLIGEVVKDKKTVATPAYMSPEQAEGEKDDDRTDQFSLGIILYEMLTGKNPFDAGTTKATIFKVANSDPTPIIKENSKVNSQMEEACFKALSKNPNNRFATVTDFRYKVERAAGREYSKKEVIQGIIQQFFGDATEKAIPDIINTIRKFTKRIFHNELLATRLISGVLPATFILLYAKNVDLVALLLISFGLFLTALVSPVISLAILAVLLVIKAFYASIFLGIGAVVFAIPYLFYANEKNLQGVFPLLAFILAKASALFLYPLLVGLLFTPVNALIVSTLGLTALGLTQLALGSKTLFFIEGGNYIAIVFQVLILVFYSFIISILSSGRSYKRDAIVIFGGLAGLVVIYMLPFWNVLDFSVNLGKVMQNISLSLIIAIAIILFIRYEHLKGKTIR